jgi:hypothetical protein
MFFCQYWEGVVCGDCVLIQFALMLATIVALYCREVDVNIAYDTITTTLAFLFPVIM